MTSTYFECIGSQSTEKCQGEHCDYLLKLSVNRASTIFSLAFRMIQGLRNNIYLHFIYRQPFDPTMLERTSRLSPKIEHQRSVKDFWSCNMQNRRAVRRLYSRIEVLAACIGKNAIDDITTASSKWSSTKCQQCLCWRSNLHSNIMHSVALKLNF